MTTGYLSREEFESGFLGDVGVLRDVLQQADYQRLTGSVGSLGAAECYFPVPYRALGGRALSVPTIRGAYGFISIFMVRLSSNLALETRRGKPRA